METLTPSVEANPFRDSAKPDLQPAFVGTPAHERGKVVKGCECADCESLRAKWREKDAVKRGKKSNPFAKSAPVSGQALPVVPGVAGVALPPIPAKPHVPWTVELVRPLLSQCADLLEKIDIESLAKEAKKLSDKCEAFVRVSFQWNPAGKLAVVEGGSECVVKYLNLAGVSAEYAPEVKTAIGALAILHGRQNALDTFKKMFEEEKAERAKREKSKDSNSMAVAA
jgi:hypothetical protein